MAEQNYNEVYFALHLHLVVLMDSFLIYMTACAEYLGQVVI